eukprot:TRINITY_DN18863_c0_g1_i1.p1 TRINITY_DN18863_c0_g1~~TRINITY_DN18863_c0_g1_i1.p1  ORF type:complete len:143 (+),score=30.71 TRINITY_DN18863_c0_g1_i1:117-545(+)
MDETACSRMRSKFDQVDMMLDHNRMLIGEINRNHEQGIPEGITRNASLIGQLNRNIKEVVEFYAEISTSFATLFPDAGNNQDVGDINAKEEQLEEEGEEEAEEEEEGSTARIGGDSFGPHDESGGSCESDVYEYPAAVFLGY